jgi:integrase
MAKRRGHSEGSISLRSDGRWQVGIDLGRGADGRRQRKCGYASTQAGAVELLRELGGREASGKLLTTSTPTVKTFLNEWFANDSETWRPSTRRSYRGAIDLYLIPAFGARRVEHLKPLLIQRWLRQQKDAHGARRRIELAHSVLRSALSEAQSLQLVKNNAAASVKVPVPKKRTITPFTVDEAAAFLQAAKRHRLSALSSVALAGGLRLGEATGLRWKTSI